MLRVRLACFCAGVAIAFNISCKKETSSKHDDGAAAVETQLPDQIAVSGTIQIDTSDESTILPDASTAADGKTVQLVDEDNVVIGEGVTGTSGAFTVLLNTTAIGLVESGSSAPRIVKIRSLFLLPGEKADAVGTRGQILISPKDVKTSVDGTSSLSVGTHTVKKVGAIVGKVSLETNENAIGVDVYIPGTTQIAKTDENGQFLIGFLQPGTFDLRADRDGFNSLDWTDVVVQQRATTHLDLQTMKISKGPKVEQFELISLDEVTGVAVIGVKLSGASRYRIGKVQDFSDAQFRPFDNNVPEFTANQIVAGVRILTFYIEAVDSDGLSAKSSFTIDRDAPYLGSIGIADEDKLIGGETVSLVLSVTNGTKMRFAEGIVELKTAVWQPYATSFSYSLTDKNDGLKTIYAEFSDDAGNSIGASGEISATFTLDNTVPSSQRIDLLSPASPTGAFNTPLSWQSSIAETVSYQIQIFSNSNYTGTPVRDLATSDTIVITNPPLTTAGTYYWRVRATDLAGNNSDWVNSGVSKSFSLKVLREAYQAKQRVYGNESKDGFLGRAFVTVGDLTGDTYPEIAYSILSTETSTCTNCGAVKIMNPITGAVLATITEDLDRSESYGSNLTVCDLNNDGKDELVVGAPSFEYVRNDYYYRGVGAIFVYSLSDFKQLASTTSVIPAGDPAIGYSCWQEWDQKKNLNVQRCGTNSFPSPLDGFMGAADQSSRQFGASVSCMRLAGADRLIVGEPQYQEMPWTPKGRVSEIQLNSSSLEVVSSIIDVQSYSRFGASTAYLSNFNWSGGTCGTGATIAVGAPDTYSGQIAGVVHLYQKQMGAWARCDSINPDVGDTWDQDRWGARLFNLGDIDDDGTFDELAVANNGMRGGVVRIYGGTSGALLKSLKLTSEESSGLGYFVGRAGDLDEDGNIDLAIGVPRARVNGVYDAGKTLIYSWDAIDDDDSDADMDSDTSPLLVLSDKPKGGSFLGAGYVAIVANNNFAAKPLSMFLSSPGATSAENSCPPPGPCGGGTAPGMAGFNGPTGGYTEFAFLKLAPTLPLRLSGSSTGAEFGASIVATSDLDGDSATDVIIGQKGARCNGRPYGALSVYSVLDGSISRHICAAHAGHRIGEHLLYSPSLKTVIFSNKNKSGPGPTYHTDLYAASHNNIMTLDVFDQLGGQQKFSEGGGINKTFLSQIRAIPGPGSEQHFASGNPENGGETGRVKLIRLSAAAMDPGLNQHVEWTGMNVGDQFGAAVDLIQNISGVGAGHEYEVVVGVPGIDVSGTDGAVFVIDGTKSGGVVNGLGVDPLILVKIVAKDLNGAGEDALAGFGSFVVGLPDFGAYDPDGVNFLADAYVFVSNSNMTVESSSNISEYYIFAVRASDGAFLKVKHEVGTAGSMIGGYARLLPDVNGDGFADLAISHPGGIGQLGSTGHVQIISGKGLTTPDAADDVMQVFYNPDASGSNFGVAVEYGDITGDGVPDFVIGANEFDTSAFQDAGAVYIFTMESVK